MWNRREFLRGSAAIGSAAAIALSDRATAFASWPQWRGPTRNGQAAEGSDWPESLTKDRLAEAWRVELGPSYSGPVLTDDLVFTTETADRKREVISALNRKTGEQVWQTDWDGSISVPFFARSNGSWIRSTPTVSGDRLFVAGMRDVLVCLNANTGEVDWQIDFVKSLETPLPAFGFVCSPLVVGDAVYVQAGASLAKLNKATGELLWRSLEDGGGMFGSAFSSPIHCELAGKQQIVVQTRTLLAGVDPDNGNVLWQQEVPAFRGGKSFLYRLAAASDGLAVEEVWNNKLQGYMSSPVIHQDHAYIHLKNQRFACIELASGKEKWITKPFGQYWSMIANGDRLLALDQRGELLHIRLNPDEFTLLSSLKLSEAETWAHLAVSNQQIFIRELNALVAYNWS